MGCPKVYETHTKLTYIIRFLSKFWAKSHVKPTKTKGYIVYSAIPMGKLAMFLKHLGCSTFWWTWIGILPNSPANLLWGFSREDDVKTLTLWRCIQWPLNLRSICFETCSSHRSITDRCKQRTMADVQAEDQRSWLHGWWLVGGWLVGWLLAFFWLGECWLEGKHNDLHDCMLFFWDDKWQMIERGIQ